MEERLEADPRHWSVCISLLPAAAFDGESCFLEASSFLSLAAELAGVEELELLSISSILMSAPRPPVFFPPKLARHAGTAFSSLAVESTDEALLMAGVLTGEDGLDSTLAVLVVVGLDSTLAVLLAVTGAAAVLVVELAVVVDMDLALPNRDGIGVALGVAAFVTFVLCVFHLGTSFAGDESEHLGSSFIASVFIGSSFMVSCFAAAAADDDAVLLCVTTDVG